MTNVKCFSGVCNSLQLIEFSFGVLGIYLRGGLPKDSIAISASRGRRSCHCAFNKMGVMVEPDTVIMFRGARIGFYNNNNIVRFRWISRGKNELTIYKHDTDLFSIILVERVYGPCHYRHILEKNKVELTSVP